MEKKIQISILNGFWLLIFAYSCTLMVEITWRYHSFALDANFLMIKQTEVEELWWYKYVFYTHVCTAILALPAGFTQFNLGLLTKYPRLHRTIGYVYVLSILGFAAPSGALIVLLPMVVYLPSSPLNCLPWAGSILHCKQCV